MGKSKSFGGENPKIKFSSVVGQKKKLVQTKLQFNGVQPKIKVVDKKRNEPKQGLQTKLPFYHPAGM